MMPVLFIGHGSPMNAIQNNAFTQTLTKIGAGLEKPRAILVVSAHWLTQGTFITSSAQPKMIYDMYGFPEALYQVKYPAQGDQELATQIQKNSDQSAQIRTDNETWGLDHGSWSILKFLFPNADVPVLQLSIDMTKGLDNHYQIGLHLHKLRKSGVLIIGSGNIVHNLRKISWNENEKPFEWAVEYDEWFKQKLIDRDFSAIMNDFSKTTAGQLSVPSLDHYLPVHYILGAAKKDEKMRFEFEGMQNGSISMRAFRFG